MRGGYSSSKKAGVDLFRRISWRPPPGPDDPPPGPPASEEEVAALFEGAEAIATLLMPRDPLDPLYLARRYALAMMLAQVYRVLMDSPLHGLMEARAIVQAIAGRPHF